MFLRNVTTGYKQEAVKTWRPTFKQSIFISKFSFHFQTILQEFLTVFSELKNMAGTERFPFNEG
jgi:hypothetical protein